MDHRLLISVLSFMVVARAYTLYCSSIWKKANEKLMRADNLCVLQKGVLGLMTRLCLPMMPTEFQKKAWYGMFLQITSCMEAVTNAERHVLLAMCAENKLCSYITTINRNGNTCCVLHHWTISQHNYECLWTNFILTEQRRDEASWVAYRSPIY